MDLHIGWKAASLVGVASALTLCGDAGATVLKMRTVWAACRMRVVRCLLCAIPSTQTESGLASYYSACRYPKSRALGHTGVSANSASAVHISTKCSMRSMMTHLTTGLQQQLCGLRQPWQDPLSAKLSSIVS